jgi:CHAT domain-containing protein
MVALDLSDDVVRAFSRWEWYKGASLRGLPSANEHRRKENSGSEFQDATWRNSPLPEGTALVSYAVFQQGAAVWIDDGQTIRTHWISMPKKDLDSMVSLFAAHCSHQDSSVEELKKEGSQLYRVLVGPIDDLLRPYRRVIIEPDEQLWLVSFQALIDPAGQYFGDRFAVSFSPGLAYLSFARSWKGITEDSRALIVGDPKTDNWTPLPEGEEEAKGIASQFRYTHLLLRGDATFENVVAAVGDVDVFHFSGHATASPRGVGLVLQNSTLFGADQLGTSAFGHSQLVVLSACSSANGGAGAFNDHDSVARSVMSLGVPAIVASRWMVDSRATSLLMQRFYHHLLDGEPVSEAFANATRELRAQAPYGHPFYWASFSVFGKG